MSTDSSSVGSATVTGWKRRSSAASFSTCLRYSLSVVAPMTWISPRPSAGFDNVGGVDGAFRGARADDRMQLVDEQHDVGGLDDLVDGRFDALLKITPVFRAGHHADRSSETTRLSLSVSGTSPVTMRCARPSAMAVLPTPGSPISTGLFFVRGRGSG